MRKKLRKPNKQTILIILILFLTVFIKTIYLQNTIFPTATDLGHHMYWSKQISETGKLPVYQKIKIVKDNSGDYLLSKPQPISDFIIGEHLIFSAINLISGIPFISYFPTLVLFLINIIGLLAIFILALRLSDVFFEKRKVKQGINSAIFVLLLIGPLWALSSPQAKFVSGGVIGNMLGNLFIPLCVYFYFRAFKEKNSRFLATGLLLTMGLFYTHHLSGFIFLFTVFFILATLIFLFVVQRKPTAVANYLKLFFSPSVAIFILFAILFLFLVYTPAYITNHATGTAVGAPSKATRAGLTFTQFKYAVGEPRLALGIIGLFFLFLFQFKDGLHNGNKKNKSTTLTSAILIGWTLAVSLMTLKPQWLHINLPSGRVANYANFPFVILSGFALMWIIGYATAKNGKKYLPQKTFLFALLLLFTFAFSAGYYDNSQSLVKKPNNQKALQTFRASEYLKNHTNKNTGIVLKDHNYLKADSWIKLFLMQDYSIPFSRSYFKRYNDPTKPREMCTLLMISNPNSDQAIKCYNELNVKFVIINPKIDSAQFDAQQNFWKVYTGDDVAIYRY